MTAFYRRRRDGIFGLCVLALFILGSSLEAHWAGIQ